MKSSTPVISKIVRTVIAAMVCLIVLPEAAEAKGPKSKKNHGNGHGSGNKNYRQNYRQSDRGDHDGRDRQYYTSRPRSTFVLSLGTGYAGRGYYYGPANSPYYYQRSDVRYFATREAAPREYYGNEGYQDNTAVQRELARRGYYNGPSTGRSGRNPAGPFPAINATMACGKQERSRKVCSVHWVCNETRVCD